MTGALVSFAVGFALAIIIGLFAAVVGLGRENGFYPTMLMVIAGYYVLFAALAADLTAMTLELAGFFVFCTLAVIGFRGRPWGVVAGLIAHGLFDALHGLLFANPGAPGWWSAFCSGFDLAIAAWLGWMLAGLRRSGDRDDQLYLRPPGPVRALWSSMPKD
jgi:hypothetical protein